MAYKDTLTQIEENFASEPLAYLAEQEHLPEDLQIVDRVARRERAVHELGEYARDFMEGVDVFGQGLLRHHEVGVGILSIGQR